VESNWHRKLDSAPLAFVWELTKICLNTERIPLSPKPEWNVTEKKQSQMIIGLPFENDTGRRKPDLLSDFSKKERLDGTICLE
jgi:hypothetical protein